MKPLLKRTGTTPPAKSDASVSSAGQQPQELKERESEALPLKYRPRTFEEMAGNEETIATLESIFGRKQSDVPHAFLLFGPSGCGKTTIARIIKSILKVADTNYREFNTANTRGIDTIRDVVSTARLTGLRKGVKMYLFDECFTKGVKVRTPEGTKHIEDIQEGDTVYSSIGEDTVIKTFRKKIPLNRLVKVTFADGRILFCSDHHEFFTEEGWVFSKDLKEGQLTIPFSSEIIQNINSLKKEKFDETMPFLQDIVRGERQVREHSGVLQQEMCCTPPSGQRDSSVYGMRKVDSVLSEQAGKVQQEILQPEMFSFEQIETPGNTESAVFREFQEENISETETISRNRGRKTKQNESIRENASTQSFQESRNNRKNEIYQAHSGDTSCICGSARRERKSNESANYPCNGIGMGNGICGNTRDFEEGFSDKLQIGHCKSQIKNWDRSGREDAQAPSLYAERYKENGKTIFPRVACVEVYQRGNNNKSFIGAFTDSEKDEGFVTLYDIQMKNHPSFFVEDILVHNCHQLTKDAQNAMLKLLEDAPKHVYFVLATTEPEKLLKTIHTRCTTLSVKPLSIPAMVRHLKKVCENENATVPGEVLTKISQISDGLPREAMKLLDTIIDLKSEEDMLNAIVKGTSEDKQVIELCRVLMEKNADWKKVSGILQNLDCEPESARYAILGYLNSVLLKSGSSRVIQLIKLFEPSFMYSKKAGLSAACACAVKGLVPYSAALIKDGD